MQQLPKAAEKEAMSSLQFGSDCLDPHNESHSFLTPRFDVFYVRSFYHPTSHLVSTEAGPQVSAGQVTDAHPLTCETSEVNGGQI